MQIFYILLKFFKSLWWVQFCWMSPRTEILATPLQYRTWVELMYKIFSPRTKILEYLYNCTLYITVVLLGSRVFERAENGNAVLCNYIDFDVLFQKIVQYKFYNTLIVGRAEKQFCGPCRKFRPGWHL